MTRHFRPTQAGFGTASGCGIVHAIRRWLHNDIDGCASRPSTWTTFFDQVDRSWFLRAWIRQVSRPVQLEQRPPLVPAEENPEQSESSTGRLEALCPSPSASTEPPQRSEYTPNPSPVQRTWRLSTLTTGPFAVLTKPRFQLNSTKLRVHPGQAPAPLEAPTAWKVRHDTCLALLGAACGPRDRWIRKLQEMLDRAEKLMTQLASCVWPPHSFFLDFCLGRARCLRIAISSAHGGCAPPRAPFLSGPPGIQQQHGFPLQQPVGLQRHTRPRRGCRWSTVPPRHPRRRANFEQAPQGNWIPPQILGAGAWLVGGPTPPSLTGMRISSEVRCSTAFASPSLPKTGSVSCAAKFSFASATAQQSAHAQVAGTAGPRLLRSRPGSRTSSSERGSWASPASSGHRKDFSNVPALTVPPIGSRSLDFAVTSCLRPASGSSGLGTTATQNLAGVPHLKTRFHHTANRCHHGFLFVFRRTRRVREGGICMRTPTYQTQNHHTHQTENPQTHQTQHPHIHTNTKLKLHTRQTQNSHTIPTHTSCHSWFQLISGMCVRLVVAVAFRVNL